MKLHEYQAKELLQACGVRVLKGVLVEDSSKISEAIAALSPEGPWVVKAQVHAGGRGKAGGVKLCKSRGELLEEATRMLGMKLVSHQTGPQGVKVRKVMLVDGCTIRKEIYVSVLLDRTAGLPVMIASAEGGMEIEKLAAEQPDKILKTHLDPLAGMQPYQARELAYALAQDYPSDHTLYAELAETLLALACAFFKYDASLVEINPLVITTQEEVVALDAKLTLDANALFRHSDLAALRDKAEENPKELQAQESGLNYIALEGNIGCLVNGAGLAMASMDLIKLHGGLPNNFLDVGGGASPDSMLAAFRLLLSDPQIKGILVNIFGGIVRCDLVAQGIIEAAKEVKVSIPMVVRLEGTRAEEARKMLAVSGLPIIPAEDFNQATFKIVQEAS